MREYQEMEANAGIVLRLLGKLSIDPTSKDGQFLQNLALELQAPPYNGSAYTSFTIAFGVLTGACDRDGNIQTIPNEEGFVQQENRATGPVTIISTVRTDHDRPRGDNLRMEVHKGTAVNSDATPVADTRYTLIHITPDGIEHPQKTGRAATLGLPFYPETITTYTVVSTQEADATR